VNLVDANVLLYAYNEADPHHPASLSWLEGAMAGGETVAYTWTVLLAFIRLSTKVGLFPQPLDGDTAIDAVRAWTSPPQAVILEPGPRHLELVADLLRATGTAGNLTSDAHLGALALEHGATVITFDSDFGRFPGVRWNAPREGG
jgi:toxin-antitoxin system PIN domain toxin